MITWNELVLAEPLLKDLEEQTRAEAAKAQTDPQWSFSLYWSRTLRPAVNGLVGWKRPGTDLPQLRTEEAWHAAISHLLGLLPGDEGALAS